MSEAETRKTDLQKPPLTQIRIKGHLGERWADWFDGLTIRREENGDTLLTGSVPDQAALYGVLRKIRDLGMPLLSIHWREHNQQDAPDIE